MEIDREVVILCMIRPCPSAPHTRQLALVALFYDSLYPMPLHTGKLKKDKNITVMFIYQNKYI